VIDLSPFVSSADEETARADDNDSTLIEKVELAAA
jgi:hypothetical protein